MYPPNDYLASPPVLSVDLWLAGRPQISLQGQLLCKGIKMGVSPTSPQVSLLLSEDSA